MADNFDINSTPADEMTKDLSMLNKMSDLSQLTKEERQKAEQLVKNILDSILSEKDMPLDKIRENNDILKDLANKGLDIAKDAMEKIKENNNENATADTINFSSVATQANGHVVAQSRGHLKETIKSLSLDSEGPQTQEEKSNISHPYQQEDSANLSQEKQQENGISDFMEKRYAQNSPERRKFEVLGPDQDRNEGNERK